MNPTNVKIVFIAAICAVLWDGYKIAKASYTALAWEKSEGTIVDFERRTWTCGKGISECYSLIIGYHAGKDYFTITGDKSFTRKKPAHLLENKVVVYYSPVNPAEAVISGSYGAMVYGITMFIIGSVVLLIFWLVRKKNQ